MHPFTYTPNNTTTEAAAENFQLSIHCLSDFTTQQLAVPRRLSEFVIVFTKKAMGTFQADEVSGALDSNHIYCFAPHQIISFQLEEPIEGFFISVDPALLALLQHRFDLRMLMDSSETFAIQLSEDRQIVLFELIEKMMRELEENSTYRNEILRSMLNLFMLYVTRESERMQPIKLNRKENELITRFLDLVQKNICEKKLVGQYADDLCVSANYLNFTVKRITGFPVSYHIQQGIVKEAKRLAMYSGLRMKDVANHFGFDDYAHFSKFFKKYAGVNFSSFSRAMQVY